MDVFDRKTLENLDVPLLIGVLVLSIIGILVVHSATAGTHYLKMQSIWVLVGFTIMLVVMFFDYRDFGSVIYLIYGVNLLLLLSVIFMGDASKGAQRWVDLGGLRLQPSEFAKVAVIITLGYVISRDNVKVDSLFDLIRPGIHVAVPMLLIFIQPDLGTSLVFVAITFGMLFVAGLKWKHFSILGAAGTAAAIFAYYKVLADYQRERLIVFMDPYKFHQSGGWQIIQSKIAVGSGGLFGNGYNQGTQSGLKFVPEAHTDFVFSVIGEEFGLLGSVFLLLLFLFIIYRILHIGMQSYDSYGTYICVGVATFLAFQVMVNVGMTLSIMPVTGLPLPFITYGGNNFMATMIAIGLVLNVGLRRERKGIF